MQVIGSELLRDPMLQSTIVDQRLPWLSLEAPSKTTRPKSTTRPDARNMPKKILNLSSNQQREKTKTRHGEPHPILFECSQHVEDEYWANLLEDMSYREFPKGFSIKSNSLSYKKSSTRLNNISLVQTDDYAELAQLIIGFISSNANIFSPEDVKNSRILELHNDENVREELKNMNWKSIKSRNVQSIHLYNYAVALGESYDIDPGNIYSVLIFHVFLTDSIDPESIVFEDGVISYIDGLCFDERSRTIFFEHNLDSSQEFFIRDPHGQPTSSDSPPQHELSKTYRVRDRNNISLSKLWRQTLRDVSKDTVRPVQRSTRTQLMTTLSRIGNDEITRLENSIIA